MQVQIDISLLFFILTTANYATPLAKRCSYEPIEGPEYHHGSVPFVPCWLTIDTACREFLPQEEEMYFNAAHRLAVIFGVSARCVDDITEELARVLDGRKTYNWTKSEGHLTIPAASTLIISDMPSEAVRRYTYI
jgi:hypothetical protein